MKTKVSAVIPVLNEQDHLEDCLIALVPQVDEIIIVLDQATTDRSIDIANDFASSCRKPKTRVLVGEYKSISANREIGTKAASNNIILSTDADTILEQDWVAKALLYFQDPQISAVIGGIYPKNKNIITSINCYVRNSIIWQKLDIINRCSCTLFRRCRGDMYCKDEVCPSLPIITNAFQGEGTMLQEQCLSKGTQLYKPEIAAYTDIPKEQQIQTILGISTILGLLHIFTR